MYWLLVSSALSEMSPEAPGRITKTGRFESARNPELTKSSPKRAKGVGIWRLDNPDISHSALPFKSYDRNFRDPVVTISVRRSFSQTNGLDQLLPSSRSMRHSSRPILAS